jgi:O-Antigen ligase
MTRVLARVSLAGWVTGGIAVAYAALALADGGSSVQLIAGATFVIWWAVIVGLALGILPRARIPIPAIVSGASLGALGLLAALSMAWATDDGRAFIEVVRIAGYLGLFLLVLLVSPRGSARVWLCGLAIGFVAVALLALGSRFDSSLPGGGGELAAFLPDAQGRLSYPIGYWNALGACMALGAILLTWLGARATQRIARALAVAGVPLCGLALFLTSSRGAVIAVLVGLALLIAVGPARPRLLGGLLVGGAGTAVLIVLASLRDEFVDGLPTSTAESQGNEMLVFTLAVAAAVGVGRYLADEPIERVAISRRLAWALGAGVAAGAIAVAIAADPVRQVDEFCDPPPTRLASAGDAATDISRLDSSGRCQYWEVAFDGFADHPLKGVGAGGYETLWNQNAPFTRPIRNAHSLFMEFLGELGIPGLLLLAGFLGPAVYAGWGRRNAESRGGEYGATVALFAAGATSAAIEWTWELPAAFLPVVVAVALLVGRALDRPAEDWLGPEARREAFARRRFGWGVATLVLGWAAIWVAGVVFFTEAKLEQSEAGAARGELEDAAQDARDAATLQPWTAEPWIRLALLEELSGDFAAAHDAISEASTRAPEDWRIWLINTRLEIGLDDVDEARASLERARELNPMASIFQRPSRLPAPDGVAGLGTEGEGGTPIADLGVGPGAAGEALGEALEPEQQESGVPANREAPFVVSRR